MSSTPVPTILAVLQQGKISLRGEFMWGSNYTYLAEVEFEGEKLQAVYKPTKGVRPLWDFPTPSLARREVAAYVASQALGWDLVPPTSFRRDGPLGTGSLQLFIEHDPEYHYFNFNPEDRQRLRPTVLFDLIANNADRKGSHILLDEHRHIWLIDHGICFHAEDKLRTVAWDFAGEPIPAKLSAELQKFHEKLVQEDLAGENPGKASLQSELAHFLTHTEVIATRRRLERLLASGCFPNPDPNRRQYPWPPV